MTNYLYAVSREPKAMLQSLIERDAALDHRRLLEAAGSEVGAAIKNGK